MIDGDARVDGSGSDFEVEVAGVAKLVGVVVKHESDAAVTGDDDGS